MSGKYENKKPKQKKPRWAIVAVVCAALIGTLAAVWPQDAETPVTDPAETTASTPTGTTAPMETTTAPTETTTPAETTAPPQETASAPTETTEPVPETTAPPAEPTELTEPSTAPADLEEVEETSINLGSGMRIVDVGKYTGIYMEDGSDELVSGVMMIVVTNEGESDIEYAEIRLPVGDQTAQFSLSVLPAGKTVILLEQNRMPYVGGSYTTAIAENVVLFQEPLSLCEDRLKLQVLDGVINVSNVSGADITDDIVIYYKNSAVDAFYGGITYRVRIEGGLKAEELKQIVAGHFTATGSTIVFVTCGVG